MILLIHSYLRIHVASKSRGSLMSHGAVRTLAHLTARLVTQVAPDNKRKRPFAQPLLFCFVYFVYAPRTLFIGILESGSYVNGYSEQRYYSGQCELQSPNIIEMDLDTGWMASLCAFSYNSRISKTGI